LRSGNEIDEAIRNKKFDVAAKKICAIKDEAVDCFETFLDALDPCLNDEEFFIKEIAIDIIKGLLDFTCENEGLLVLLMSENGTTCIESKKSQLVTCFKQTYGVIIAEKADTEEKFIKMIEEILSTDTQNLENCIVDNLKTCHGSTSVDLTKSLLKSFNTEKKKIKSEKTKVITEKKKVKEAKKVKKGRKSKRSSASLPGLSIFALITSIVIGFYSKHG